MGFAVDSSGIVHVLDARLRRISSFQPTPEGLVHIRDLTTAFPAFGICILDDDFFLLTPNASEVVVRLDSTGQVVRRFGKQIGIPQEEARLGWYARGTVIQYNQGELACMPAAHAVVLLHRLLPLVRAFSPDGAVLWETRLADYHQSRPEFYRGGPQVYRAPDPKSGTANSGCGIAPVDDRMLVITLCEYGPSIETEFEFRFLSSGDGQELGRPPAPAVLSAIAARTGYGHVGEPYPKVVLFRR